MGAWENFRVYIAWDSTPTDPAPVWTDVTAWVDTVARPMDTTIGATAETEGEPSGFTVTFHNADQRFTPGNLNSPWAPNIKPGKQIRYVEQVGPWLHTVFTGHIAFPEAGRWTASTPSSPRSQTITYTAVDVLARIDTPETFLSNVGAQIRTADIYPYLQAFWPLVGDSSTTVQPAVGDGVLQPHDFVIFAGERTDSLLQPAGGAKLPGDDLTPMHWLTPGHTGGLGGFPGAYRELVAGLDPGIVLAGGQTLTVMVWTRSQDCAGTAPDYLSGFTFRLDAPAGPTICSVELEHFDSLSKPFIGAEFAASVADLDGGWFAGVNNGRYNLGQPLLHTIQITLGADLLWYINDRPVLTGTTSGSPAASYAFDTLTLGRIVSGDICYMQIYLAPTGAITQAHHLAQWQAGINAYDRQSTGDRIALMAGYAGIPNARLDLESGESLMPALTLAGKTALAEMRSAEETEQGLLHVTGDGVLRFTDRRNRYNI